MDRQRAEEIQTVRRDSDFSADSTEFAVKMPVQKSPATGSQIQKCPHALFWVSRLNRAKDTTFNRAAWNADAV